MAYKCTCPEDWQGIDHTHGCRARDQLRRGNERAKEAAAERGYELHPKLQESATANEEQG